MRVGPICTALVLAMIAVPLASANDVLLVSPKIIEFYNGAYKSLKPPRAIAVSADGFSFGYSYCPEHRCTVNPTARDLAMQACVKSGRPGCRIFAIDDDIKVDYRVMELSNLGPPKVDVVQPEPTQPCVGKTPEQCQKIRADFAEQRKQIEVKWAKTIDKQRRFYCYGYGASPPCNVVKKSEADRDAELSALDAELLSQLAQ